MKIKVLFFIMFMSCQGNAQIVDSVLTQFFSKNLSNYKTIFIKVDPNVFNNSKCYNLKNIRKLDSIGYKYKWKNVAILNTNFYSESFELDTLKIEVQVQMIEKRRKGHLYYSGEVYFISILKMKDGYYFYLNGGLKPYLFSKINT